MCRFLVVKSKTKINPQPLLVKFSQMAKKSRAFDGDWQGDGWGMSWLDEKNNWQIHKSTKPIWEEVQSIDRLDLTNIFAIHARSASFPQHKDNIEYNQPFIFEPYAFVFNGLLKGVTLSLKGEIGSQKIWNLLQQFLKKYPVEVALEKVKDIMSKKSKELQAMNIAVADKKNIFALCYYSNHEKYYQLHRFHSDDLQFVCSEPLSGFSSKPVFTNQVIKI